MPTTATPAAPIPALQAELLVVTPEMAAAWLKERHPNRPLKPPRVSELANIMRQPGQWVLNGETLVFSTEGRLLDGQNRLAALVEAGVSLQFLIVRGVQLDAQSSLGQGVRRTVADILATHQQVNVHALASMVKLVWQVDHKCIVPPQRTFPNQDTCTVLARYPGLPTSLSWETSVRKFMPVAVGGAMHFLAHRCDPTQAKQVFEVLRTGTNLHAGHAMHGLREKLIEAKTRTPKVKSWIYLYWTVLSWNALRQDKSAPLLPWEPRVSADRFPQVQ